MFQKLHKAGTSRTTARFAALMLAVVLLFGYIPGMMIAHMQGNETPGAGSNLPLRNVNFSDLTFSTSGAGPAMTYFPVGTQQVFARWNYNGIPVGTRLLRQWYRDGTLFIQKDEPWSAAWGSSGRLTHISIFDFTEGLTPGYYHVVISLVPGYLAAQVTGDFVIAGYPATVVPPSGGAAFSNLTVSTSAAGPDIGNFPAGSPLISARWNYANIPVGALMQRDWYRNGVLFRSLQEPWSSYWGSSGRLTHIALYNYERGLASGNYRLNIYLRDNPAVQANVNFVIGDAPGGNATFSNLTFSNSTDGSAMGVFAPGTEVIYARWDFANVPPGTTVLRRWYRNGVLWLERQEVWANGTQGSVRNISIYDYQYGLLPGDYYVEMSLIGIPNSLVVGYFTIQ